MPNRSLFYLYCVCHFDFINRRFVPATNLSNIELFFENMIIFWANHIFWLSHKFKLAIFTIRKTNQRTEKLSVDVFINSVASYAFIFNFSSFILFRSRERKTQNPEIRKKM